MSEPVVMASICLLASGASSAIVSQSESTSADGTSRSVLSQRKYRSGASVTRHTCPTRWSAPLARVMSMSPDWSRVSGGNTSPAGSVLTSSGTNWLRPMALTLRTALSPADGKRSSAAGLLPGSTASKTLPAATRVDTWPSKSPIRISHASRAAATTPDALRRTSSTAAVRSTMRRCSARGGSTIVT